MSVKVRFAPSPTGSLHIGSVRAALFNWLFARRYGGSFFLRIEDTDIARSTKENIDSIFDTLKWLGLNWDGEPVIQSERQERHIAVAEDMVACGVAYRCYCSQKDLARRRTDAMKHSQPYQYDRSCRNLDNNDQNNNDQNNNDQNNNKRNFVIRLKTELIGKTEVCDMVQGQVLIQNDQIDDFILVRTDGTPTYMLSVVVDDHDMEITHVIRGDDHFTNTFRQLQIYQACGWDSPRFAHIPLIYGSDGAKLSKRYDAISAEEYKDKGYLAESILNYLLRLGWSHGDDEIISIEKAVEWFGFDAVGKSPARFDILKLNNLNTHYIREKDDVELLQLILPFIEQKINIESQKMIIKGMMGLKKRAKTLVELAEAAMIYVSAPKTFDVACEKYAQKKHLEILDMIVDLFIEVKIEEEVLHREIKNFATKDVKFIEVAQALRAALCGKLVSPSVFEIISIIGAKDTIARIRGFQRFFA